jgi:hypothetical protein
MKKLTLIAAGLPGAALAHGAHPPVEETLHATAHSGMWVGIGLVVVVGVVIWATRVRS